MLLALVSLVGCTQEVVEFEALNKQALSAEEVRNAFFDATCYCESYLHLSGNAHTARLIDQKAAACDGDALLSEYVAEHSDDDGKRLACGTLRASPHRRLPDRTAEDYTAFPDDGLTNGCVQASWIPPSPEDDEFDERAFGSPPLGFCRADFNYCVANQLRLKSESFAKAPGSLEALVAIQQEARERYQLAASEYAWTAVKVTDLCDEPAAEYGGQCDRMNEGYGRAVTTRLTDAASQVQSLLELETRNLTAIADEVTPGSAGKRGYGEAVWGSEEGDEGPRFLAAQRLLGLGRPAEPLFAEPPDLMEEGYWLDDHRPVELAKLFMTHRIPTGYFRDVEGILEHRNVDEQFALAAFNLLDHRLAIALQIEPPPTRTGADGEPETAWNRLPLARNPETGESVVVSRSAFLSYARKPVEENSPLRESLGFREGHAYAALQYIRMLTTAFDVDYTHVPVVSDDGSYLAVELNDDTVRAQSLVPLGGSLGTASTGVPIPEVLDRQWGGAASRLGQNSCPANVSGGVDGSDNWYRLDLQHLQDVGATGASQILRVALLALDSQRALHDQEWLDDARPQIDSGVSLLDSYLGERWTEYRYDPAPSGLAFGVGGSVLDSVGVGLGDGATVDIPNDIGTVPIDVGGDDEAASAVSPGDGSSSVPDSTRELPGDVGGSIPGDDIGGIPVDEIPPEELLDDNYNRSTDAVWSAVGEWSDEGGPVYVTDKAHVYCLQYGHWPGYEPGTGCPSAEPMPPIGLTAVFDRIKRNYKVEDVAEISSSRIFILWRTCEDDDDETSCEYRLVDSFEPRGSGVHAWGGEFGSLIEAVSARAPRNPVAPETNSLDLDSGLVPPLEHELIDDSDGFEDSWRYYLSQARESAAFASRLLTTAREQEIEMVRYDNATDAQFDLAANAQRELVSSVCGADSDEATCEIVQRDVITLDDLGLAYVDRSLPVEVDLGAIDSEYEGEDPVECEEFVSKFGQYFSLPQPPDGGDAFTYLVGRVESLFSDGDGGYEEQLETYVDAYLTKGLQCARRISMEAAANAQLRGLPERVIREIRRDGDGNFSDTGGQIREQYIQLYSDFVALRQTMDEFDRSFTSAEARVDIAAREVRVNAEDNVGALLCGLNSAVGGLVSIGTGVAQLYYGDARGVDSISRGSAMLESGGDQCNQGNEAAANAALTALMDVVSSMGEILQLRQTARMLIMRVASADNVFEGLQRQVRIGRDRQRIQETLATYSSVAGLPSWRALQGVTAERARRALFRAQQRAFIARRAIEFRLALDMGTMTSPEPFVDGPDGWVGEVFRVHGAAQRTSPSSSSFVSISAEALEDHNQRLEDFVEGYPFARRFSEGRDVQILSLNRLTPLDVPALAEGSAVPVSVDPAQPLSERLYFKCHNHDQLLRGGRAEGDETSTVPCADELGGVDYAVHSFYLSTPLRGYVEDRLAAGNFNFRVRTVALNGVGTGLVDCRRASDSEECYASGNLQYSLRHSGEVSIESYEHHATSFLMEPGVIQRARMLAAERFLTNPLSTTDRALIEPYQRSEWWGRPLSGVYTVTLYGRPEIEWRNLEDVQVLLTYDYWTRQE